MFIVRQASARAYVNQKIETGQIEKEEAGEGAQIKLKHNIRRSG